MTDRVIYTTVAGRPYPLCLTLRATKEITKRFGGLENLADALSGAELAEQLDAMTWLLSLLMAEASAMLCVMGEEAPPPLTAEMLETVLTPGDLIEMQGDLLRTVRVGVGREVEGKNAEAGPTSEASLPG